MLGWLTGLLAALVLCSGNASSVSQTKEMKMRHGAGTVYSVRHFPDDKRLLSASYDGSVIMWDLASGKRLWQVDLDADSKSSNSSTISHIRDMDLSPDGSIVAASYDRDHVVGDTIKGRTEFHIALLDSSTGRVSKTLTGHTDHIGRLAFSHNGELLLSESADNTARLWNVKTGQQVLLINLKEKGASVAFSPDGKVVAVATQPLWGLPPQPIVGLYDAGTGRLLREFPRSKNAVTGLAFSPDGRLAIAGGDAVGSQLEIWDLNSQDVSISIPMRGREINSLAFSSDGRFLALGGYAKGRGLVEIRDLSEEKVVATTRYDAKVTALDFSRDGKQLVAGMDNGQIILLPPFK